jgi:predicted NBD/HSP70 family sugar kinase
LLSAAGIAAGLPFFIKRMLNPSNQVFHDQPAVVEALHDFLGKTVWA